MNLSEMSIAYSPENPILEDIVRTACVNLFVDNIRDILELVISQIPDFPEIPPDINFNSTFIIEIAKFLVKVRPYNNSHDLRSIYVDEIFTRKVLAAVEFDDDLAGQY